MGVGVEKGPGGGRTARGAKAFPSGEGSRSGLGPVGGWRCQVRRHLSGLWVSTAPGAPAIQRLQRLCWAPGRLARQAFLFLLALIGSWVPGWSRGPVLLGVALVVGVAEAAGGDVDVARAAKMGFGVFFSPVASHPRGTKENVNVNVRACYRKQYPLAIICTSICEEREEAERERGENKMR